MNAITADPAVEVALFRSAMYEALALAFTYPTPETRERLVTLIEDLEAFDATARSGYQDDLRRLREAVAGATLDVLAAVHNHLFEQSSICSPFETEYEADPFAKGRQLADIAGFYHAFGMTVSSIRPTMADFIGTELEFMSLLSRKEAYATVRGWKRRRTVTVEAERSFLRDHLGRWERAICREIATHVQQDDAAAEDAYSVAAQLTTRFVGDDVQRFQARPLRLTQRMLGNQDPVTCPFAAPDEDPPILDELADGLDWGDDPEERGPAG